MMRVEPFLDSQGDVAFVIHAERGEDQLILQQFREHLGDAPVEVRGWSWTGDRPWGPTALTLGRARAGAPVDDGWQRAARYLEEQGAIHARSGSRGSWGECLLSYARTLRQIDSFRRKVLSRPPAEIPAAVEAWLREDLL